MKKIISFVLLVCYFGFQQACFAIDYSQLDVQKNQTVLNSRLKKDFSGYEYVITNNFKEKLNIVNAQIINGQDGNTGYMKSEAEGAMAVTWAIAGPVGLFTLGIGWAVGLLATPVVWFVQNNQNKKTRTESIAYTNIVPIGNLNPAESIMVKSLVPIGSQPQLKLTIMDSKNNLHVVNK
jgi:hypothetical protein